MSVFQKASQPCWLSAFKDKMPKSRAPAFQFYVGDYLQDTRMLSLEAKGAWMDCLCQMWIAPQRGQITYDAIGYARLFGCDISQAKAVLNELINDGICDALPKRYQDVTENNQRVTILSRRMLRDEKLRKANADKQKRHRKKKKTKESPNSNHTVTPPLQSTSTTSTTIKEKKKAAKFIPPSLSQIKEYVKEKKYSVDPETFLNFYNSKAWYVGKNKMKCWKASIAGWHTRDSKNGNSDKPELPTLAEPEGWRICMKTLYTHEFDGNWQMLCDSQRAIALEIIEKLK